MARKEKFISLSSIVDNEPIEVGKGSQTTLVFDASVLPNFTNSDGSTLKEQIGINLKALQRRCVVAGIPVLKIVGEAGKVSRDIPTIVKRNDDGTAVAGKTATREKVSTHATDIEGDVHTIRLNLSEMSRKIQEKSPIRSAEAWANEWNSAIELALLEHQINKLKTNSGIPVVTYNLVQAAIASGISGNSLAFLEMYAISSAVFNTTIALLRKKNEGSYGHPFAVERIVLNGLLGQKDWFFGAKNLVRAISQPKK